MREVLATLARGTEPRGPVDASPGAPLVLVACSGGADSLALAACVAAEARKHGIRAGAVVVDHAMQPGSAQVASHAGRQCEDLGLDPVRIVKVYVPARGAGPEANARTARYDALSTVAAELGAVQILLGHTLDDQAETVLLGLARGAGARSLAGMASSRGLLRRPFLTLTRAQTEQVCEETNLDFWTDPTNVAPAECTERNVAPSAIAVEALNPGAAAPWPLRSRVRSTLMPALTRVLGPGVVGALARSAEQLREDDDLLSELADRALTMHVVDGPESGPRGRDAPDALAPSAALRVVATVVLDAQGLAVEPDAIRRRVLHRAAVAAGCPPGALTRAHVLAIDALVIAWRGQRPTHLPGGIRASREYGRLVLHTPTP